MVERESLYGCCVGIPEALALSLCDVGDPYPARSEPESAPCPCWSAGQGRCLGTKGRVPAYGTKGQVCHLSEQQTPALPATSPATSIAYLKTRPQRLDEA